MVESKDEEEKREDVPRLAILVTKHVQRAAQALGPAKEHAGLGRRM